MSAAADPPTLLLDDDDQAGVKRDHAGRFVKGTAPPADYSHLLDRNRKAGRVAGLRTVAEYLRLKIPPETVAEFLVQTMQNPAARMSDRLQAARMILDRRDGAVQQSVRVDTQRQDLPDLNHVSDEGLALIIQTLRAPAKPDAGSEPDDGSEGPGDPYGAIDVR